MAPGAPSLLSMIRALVALGLVSLSYADEVEEAGRLFGRRCAACHTVPDRELKGDRAWLGQVPRTA